MQQKFSSIDTAMRSLRWGIWLHLQEGGRRQWPAPRGPYSAARAYPTYTNRVYRKSTHGLWHVQVDRISAIFLDARIAKCWPHSNASTIADPRRDGAGPGWDRS